MKNGHLFIISGPAGVGKDTILKGIIKKIPSLYRLSTYTTRAPRLGEKVRDGRIFVSEKEFRKMIENNDFLEWEKVHKWYYGAKREDVNDVLEKGESIIFDIDVKGGLTYKKLFPKNAVLIFIKFDKDISILKERIKNNRPDSSKEEIELRYKTAQKEMEYEEKYGYSVINPENHPEKAIGEVAKIIENIIMK